ncbi:ABC-2 family transporter protein [Plantibacter sp. VKM Ac-1784]|jgi:ABC-2 type transport system permease protein|uniref:ABC-2 family transporter protein n=1 Tax=Plantibacter elymi (nom. nud.) TaxID=199708 RepID=A0ABY1RIA3_9MICO|nr:ABC transporter permease subunit [Plantibacter sp. VKM Ac-1784]SMQ75136.1 ABC-2 family transporter protein [Plantibacter sp. VKM Ac-1784]
MTSLLAAIRSEFLKVFTTRVWWGLALILFVYVGFAAAGAALLFANIPGAAESSGAGAQATSEMLTQPGLIYGFATSIGYVFPVLLGALATTGEFRHQSLTPTFLANPNRGHVLVGKVLALTGVGALYGVIALAASVGLGGGALAISGIDPMLTDPDTWALIGRAVLAMALWGAIGVGLGAVLPSQVGAIIVVLAFTQFVEPLLRLASSFSEVTASIGRFLPGAATDALVGPSFYSMMSAQQDALTWWQGGLVLLGIGVVVALIGYATTWRRDVT